MKPNSMIILTELSPICVYKLTSMVPYTLSNVFLFHNTNRDVGLAFYWHLILSDNVTQNWLSNATKLRLLYSLWFLFVWT